MIEPTVRSIKLADQQARSFALQNKETKRGGENLALSDRNGGELIDLFAFSRARAHNRTIGTASRGAFFALSFSLFFSLEPASERAKGDHCSLFEVVVVVVKEKRVARID